MDELIFFINKVVISGTVIGSIYALGAVGVTLVFGILRFAHFAHGDMMTLGAFLTYSLVAIFAAMGLSAPVPLGILMMPLAMALTSVVALGLDRGFYAPLRRKGGACDRRRAFRSSCPRCTRAMNGAMPTRPRRSSCRCATSGTRACPRPRTRSPSNSPRNGAP